jgi:hypothetical protein
MNYPYYVEFLDMALRKPKRTNKGPSILQMNLFVALTSSEMIALSRLLSIIHLFIVVPCRYLAGKSHEFRDYNWSALDMNMSRVVDTLHQKLLKIKKQPDLVLDPIFMDNIFLEYRDELPPFQEYWNMLFKEKQMKVVAQKAKGWYEACAFCSSTQRSIQSIEKKQQGYHQDCVETCAGSGRSIAEEIVG